MYPSMFRGEIAYALWGRCHRAFNIRWSTTAGWPAYIEMSGESGDPTVLSSGPPLALYPTPCQRSRHHHREDPHRHRHPRRYCPRRSHLRRNHRCTQNRHRRAAQTQRGGGSGRGCWCVDTRRRREALRVVSTYQPPRARHCTIYSKLYNEVVRVEDSAGYGPICVCTDREIPARYTLRSVKCEKP